MTLSFIDDKGKHYVIDTNRVEINDVKNAEIKSQNFIMTIEEK